MNQKTRKIILTTFIFLFFVIVSGYVYYRSSDFINGPQLEILDPQDGSSFKTPLIIIRGIVENVSYIKMNEKQIFINENGIFEEKYILSSGQNFIKIEVEDRFNKKREKILDLVLLE